VFLTKLARSLSLSLTAFCKPLTCPCIYNEWSLTMGLAYSFDVLYTLSPAWERVASLGKDCGVMRRGGQGHKNSLCEWRRHTNSLSRHKKPNKTHKQSCGRDKDTQTDYERGKKGRNLPALNASHHLGFKLISLGLLGHERQVLLRL
jgi:hypothetical protein